MTAGRSIYLESMSLKLGGRLRIFDRFLLSILSASPEKHLSQT